MNVKKVGVLGCGLMGSGIAQTAAMAGYETIVREVSDDLIAKGFSGIDKSLRLNLSATKKTALPPLSGCSGFSKYCVIFSRSTTARSALGRRMVRVYHSVAGTRATHTAGAPRNLSAMRVRAFAASTSRSRGGAFVTSESSSSLAACVT